MSKIEIHPEYGVLYDIDESTLDDDLKCHLHNVERTLAMVVTTFKYASEDTIRDQPATEDTKTAVAMAMRAADLLERAAIEAAEAEQAGRNAAKSEQKPGALDTSGPRVDCPAPG